VFSCQGLVSGLFFAQKSAGIYKINFNIDRRLINSVQVSQGNQTIQSGGFNTVRLSDVDLDSIRQMIVNTVAQELNATSECVYRTTRSGRKIVSYDSGSQQRGMPVSTKKQAIKQFDKDYYVRVFISYSVVNSITLGTSITGVSRFRPVVNITIKAYNVERKRVYRKSVFVSDFDKLKSFQYTVNGVTIKNSEVLQPQQIREMLLKSLNELTERGR
jgi:hypothetical protein